MADLIDTLIEEARTCPKRIALPECESENTLRASGAIRALTGPRRS